MSALIDLKHTYACNDRGKGMQWMDKQILDCHSISDGEGRNEKR